MQIFLAYSDTVVFLWLHGILSKMPQTCVTKNCYNASGNGVGLHLFSLSKPGVLRKWVIFVQMKSWPLEPYPWKEKERGPIWQFDQPFRSQGCLRDLGTSKTKSQNPSNLVDKADRMCHNDKREKYLHPAELGRPQWQQKASASKHFQRGQRA